MDETDILKEQIKLCKRYNIDVAPSPDYLKVGIALNVEQGMLPINGLRHPPKDDTSGWYLWAGETFSEDPDFFVPMHIEHLKNICPVIIKYLGLPPGYRFLVTDNYEDVWQDESLLNV